MNKSLDNNNEKGQAALLIVIMVFLIFTILISALSLSVMKQSKTNIRQKEKEYVNKVSKKLSMWYTANAAIIDTSVSSNNIIYNNNTGSIPVFNTNNRALTNAFLMSIGINPLYHVKVYVSDNLKAGTTGSTAYNYHTFTITIPSAIYGTGSFDPASGSFTPYNSNNYQQQIYFTVNGYFIESKLYSEAVKQLSEINDNLVSYFYSQIKQSTTHDVGIDYWINNDSGSDSGCDAIGSSSGILNCTNGNFINISGNILSGYESILSGNYISSQNKTINNPWGYPILYNNSSSVNENGPPFSLTLLSITPWGANQDESTANIVSLVVQPV